MAAVVLAVNLLCVGKQPPLCSSSQPVYISSYYPWTNCFHRNNSSKRKTHEHVRRSGKNSQPCDGSEHSS